VLRVDGRGAYVRAADEGAGDAEGEEMSDETTIAADVANLRSITGKFGTDLRDAAERIYAAAEDAAGLREIVRGYNLSAEESIKEREALRVKCDGFDHLLTVANETLTECEAERDALRDTAALWDWFREHGTALRLEPTSRGMRWVCNEAFGGWPTPEGALRAAMAAPGWPRNGAS
jgi:hypothetical protein